MAFLGGDNPTVSRVRNDLRVTSLRTKESSRLPVLSLSSPGVTTRPEGSLLYDTDSGLVHYSDGLQWSPIATASAQTAEASLVWMPFGTADATTGTTWNEVYSRIQAFPSEMRKVVYLDNYKAVENSQSPGFLIPSGVYDVRGVELKYITSKNFTPQTGTGNQITLTVEDGAKLRGLRKISGNIRIDYEGQRTGSTTAEQTGACVDINTHASVDTSETVVLEGGVTFIRSNPGTDPAPFFEFYNSLAPIPAERFGYVIMRDRVICEQDSLTFGFLGNNSNIDDPTITIDADQTCVILPNNFVSLEVNNNPLRFFLTLDIRGNFFSYVGLNNFHIEFESLNPGIGSPGLSLTFRRRDSISQRVFTDTAPTVFNNFSQGFARGDIWVDTSANDSYICADPDAAGDGIWSQIN